MPPLRAGRPTFIPLGNSNFKDFDRIGLRGRPLIREHRFWAAYMLFSYHRSSPESWKQSKDPELRRAFRESVHLPIPNTSSKGCAEILRKAGYLDDLMVES